MICKPYTEDLQSLWDETVKCSRNGTFLFQRNFMDYHKDRFKDASLFFFSDKGKVVGMLPACWIEHDTAIASHGGLTYGGFIIPHHTSLIEVGEMLSLSLKYYRELGAKCFYYKPIPYIYHREPSEEALYWLFRNGAQLVSRAASQTIDLTQGELQLSTLRKRKIKRSAAESPVCSNNLEHLPAYWQLLTEVLKQEHEVKPVHTLEEISLLQNKFPGNIKLYTCLVNERVEAGVLIFECEKTAHAQYISASQLSREEGLLDALLYEVILSYQSRGFKYFDFGISTENGGRYLNTGLVFQKEGFGARTTCYDMYSIAL